MRPVYPAFVNPAVRARNRRHMSLDGAWALRIDPEERGSREGWSDGNEDFEIPINIPGSVWALEELAEKYPSFKQPNGYEGTCWVQRTFELDDDWPGGKRWLKFGGVSPTAHIWLNGHYLGYHNHAIAGFKCDATQAAIIGGTNVLTLEIAWRDLDMRGGLPWAGPSIYCGVELERTREVRIEDLFIRPRIDEREAWVTATLHNDGSEARRVNPVARTTAWQGDASERETRGEALTLGPGDVTPISIKVDMSDGKRWTPDSPFLYVITLEAVSDGKVVDAVAERFGMRNMAVEDKQLVLNHEPLMWRTSSPEFNHSPTISPLVDKEIIRRRIKAMKDMGFNGNRTHTHIYTREALDVCDEMGFLLQVEPSVISNFHEIKPYPANRDSLISKVKEIRNHASVVVICMGNENSQIMWQDFYKEQAKVHLSDIRDLAPDHLILTGCGYQGEYPEVHNDFQTPHLWSRAWKWAHGGLSAIPWAGLRHLTDEGPIVLHEYGKLTVWPDPAEDKFFRDADMPLRGNYGEMGVVALKEAGIEELLPDVVENSRRLSAACTKILLEQPRRQPGVQGYQYHCAFRVGCNRGFMDDLACHTDPQFADLPLSNGDTALLMDRDFRHRAMTIGEPVELGVYLSHFGHREIADAVLTWSIEDGGKMLENGHVPGLSFSRGKNGLLRKVRFITPDGLGKFTLHMKLESDGKEVASNHWDFWRFPHPLRALSENILITADDFRWEDDMMAHFPTLRRVDDFTDAYFGVTLSRKSTDEKRSVLKSGSVQAIISDKWTDRLADFVESGGTVLLFDRGLLPESWYVQAQSPDDIQDKGYHDIYKLYAPFRSGWDHGNAATIVHDHPMLGDFPHEGWCDLHCFELIEGAATLKTAPLPGKANPVIRVVPMWRLTGAQAGPAPENPDVARQWATEDRVYLSESKIGKGRLVVCALRLLADPAGRYLLERLVEYVQPLAQVRKMRGCH